jgi:hypothetical protein
LPIGLEIDRPELLEHLETLLKGGDRDGVLTTYLREVVGSQRCCSPAATARRL